VLKLASITRGVVVLGLGQVVGLKILRARLETGAGACQRVASWDRRRPPRGLTQVFKWVPAEYCWCNPAMEYHTVLGGGE